MDELVILIFKGGKFTGKQTREYFAIWSSLRNIKLYSWGPSFADILILLESASLLFK